MNIKQLRSHKIFGLAIFDIITSIIGMVIIFILFWKWHFSKLKVGNFILAGILLKLGGFGFLRYSTGLFPESSAFFTPFIFSTFYI